MANDELAGPRGDGYRRMIELSPAGRAGTADEIGTAAAFLMGPESAFITGSDLLMDGRATAAYFDGASAVRCLETRSEMWRFNERIASRLVLHSASLRS